MPKTSQEWKAIALEFNKKWNFPHCLGALDGKHIVIQSPMNSASEFYNYKHNFSIVLMALVDANYCFTFADIGCQGRISDSGVFRNTILFKKLDAGNLMIPEDEPLPMTDIPIPYVFVADDAFALGPHLMKPFAGIYEKSTKERILNYRLSRARRIVENVFGIMAAIFRIFRKPMQLEPEKASKIVLTCVLLQNFLRRSRSSTHVYTPPGTFDTEKDGHTVPRSWRQDQRLD
ncbi:uncharacterized protein LOC126734379 [Anthonomus grandis grandis]|uniref:uncharacterized protein LOC126734379 n=1 Tax=Anthonomus grandis grandis TaxID=2921223 RepID=UPI002165A2F5|nr:uncharacterized protein LOC126734379 [Anthonomus grandis grandis]